MPIMKIIAILIIVILAIGSYLIITQNDLDLSTGEGKKSFINEFFAWIKQVGKSSTKTVGYAVNQDWLPKDDNTTKTYVVYQDMRHSGIESLPTSSPYRCY